MKARIIVTLKSSMLDPQGKAIERRSRRCVPGVASLRQGKVFDVEIAADDEAPPAQIRRGLRKAARQHRDRELRH